MVQYIWEISNWKNFFWNEKKLLSELSKARLRQGRFIEKIATLRLDDSLKAEAEMLIQETIKTAQIEGEKYDLLSVRSSVNRRFGLSHAGLPEPKRNIEGLVEVLIDATSNYDQDLTVKRLRSWQAALFPTGYSGLRKIQVGEFRDDANGPMQVISGPIGREKIHYEAPSAKKIPAEIKEFLDWWKKDEDGLDGILRAGIAHFYFVTIHPFEDGNGRIARALTDMALAQEEKMRRRYYSLSEQILIERKEYYRILENAQKGNSDLTEWLLWFIHCFDKSLINSEILLQNTLKKAEFWRKHQEKQVNSGQRKVLNKILDAGKGNFAGGLTSRKYVSLTKVSRTTAYREIMDLVAKKMLKSNKGQGRSASYDVNWGK